MKRRSDDDGNGDGDANSDVRTNNNILMKNNFNGIFLYFSTTYLGLSKDFFL